MTELTEKEDPLLSSLASVSVTVSCYFFAHCTLKDLVAITQKVDSL